MKGFISTDQAAERLGVDERTIRRWCELGTLKATRLDPENLGSPWRIPEGEVERVIDERRRQLDGDPELF